MTREEAIRILEEEKEESCLLESYGDGDTEWAKAYNMAIYALKHKPKTGWWILTQRGKFIDINCSECGNTRIKDYAYGYTIDELNLDEINDFLAKTRMNYCECCGAKMTLKKI